MPLQVPGFLLRRLYVRGSLRRTDDGFQLELRNTLGSGYARRLLPLKVNGAEVPLKDCFFAVDGIRHSFADVTPESPFSLALNRTSVLGSEGVSLPEGVVEVTMGFEVQGLGDLSFSVKDTPASD
ncbi:MAG: hypothetical protein OXO54_12660 [Chloroflexota bacterium]|nr:hypothetical protein [Rhodospirillaceae bacterium]MDE2768671.1 hypothetical protein [Chloroflexota bacterium]MDE2899162.1 hypothetical protein [Chloroflexota bacterium]